MSIKSIPIPELQYSPNSNLLSVVAKERLQISYRPEWRAFTGSVTASILLRQILFRWERQGQKPFYKFKESCSNELYRTGDSWCEELGFSRFEFDTALKKIGFKRSSKNKEVVNTAMPVEYWTDINRLTYYTIAPEILNRKLMALYSQDPTPGFTKSENPDLYVKMDSNFTKSENPDLYVKMDSSFTKSENPDLEYKQRLRTDIKNDDVKPVNPKLDTSPPTETSSSPSFTHDFNNLMQSIPVEKRNKQVEAKIKKAIATHGVEYTQQAIIYSLAHSNGNFAGYLGKVIDHPEWHEGYVPKEVSKALSKEAKREAALAEMRKYPLEYIKQLAEADNKIAEAVLKEMNG